MDPIALAAAHLADPASTWSIGGYGALAEFAHAPGESCERAPLQVVSARGAIRVEPRAALGALAYEVLSAQPGLWHHGVLFTLPEREAEMPARQVVTELGADGAAIRPADRDARLFDLGLGSTAFAFCVRTSDDALIGRLRGAAGKGFLGAGRELGPALVAASPHRVAISRIARIEVYQPIAAEGGATPDGPHTHLILRLLRVRRDVSANIPLAPGRVPGLTLYPPHPAKDENGAPKPFARAEHEAFQRLLAQCGDPATRAAKAAVLAAIARDEPPAAWRPPAGRGARHACRIALRQLRHSGADAPALGAWERALDRPAAR